MVPLKSSVVTSYDQKHKNVNDKKRNDYFNVSAVWSTPGAAHGLERGRTGRDGQTDLVKNLVRNLVKCSQNPRQTREQDLDQDQNQGILLVLPSPTSTATNWSAPPISTLWHIMSIDLAARVSRGVVIHPDPRPHPRLA